MKNKTNEIFMRQAIKLALKGKGNVYPNPMVGCVIVKDGAIIASGYHQFFGSDHAEVNALRQAGKNSNGADLFVTLEPCNRFGKRPPCTQEIIKAKIKRVFFAVKDPTVSGSKEALEKAGIEVYCGLCKKEAMPLLKDFLAHNKIKPYVCLKLAMSLDGKIASKDFDSKWISSEKSRNLVHKMREDIDAVLVGTNTALKDNPFLSSHGLSRNPLRIAIDFDLKLPKTHHLFDGSIPTFFICDNLIKKIPSRYKAQNIHLVFVDKLSAKKNFALIIEKLNSIGIKTILIEGGGGTAWSALKAGIVDECFFFVSPKIIGGKNAVSAVGGEGFKKVKDAIKCKFIKVSRLGEDILIRARMEKKCLQE